MEQKMDSFPHDGVEAIKQKLQELQFLAPLESLTVLRRDKDDCKEDEESRQEFIENYIALLDAYIELATLPRAPPPRESSLVLSIKADRVVKKQDSNIRSVAENVQKKRRQIRRKIPTESSRVSAKK